MIFWDYCIERRDKIINAVAKDNPHLQGQVPEMKMTEQPCDISHICEFEWYEWVNYQKEGQTFHCRQNVLEESSVLQTMLDMLCLNGYSLMVARCYLSRL